MEPQAPPPGAPERDLLRFLDGLDAESRQFQTPRLSTWDTTLELFRGRIWPVRDKAPLFLANVIAPTIDRQASLLSDSKPMVRIMPRRKGLQTTATVLQATIEAGWDEYHMGTVMDDLAYSLNLFGAGFLELCWDPLANFGAGDIVPTAWDPRQVRFDPAITRAYDLNQAQYLIFDSVRPLWELWRRFPGRGQLVTGDAALAMPHDEAQSPGVVARTWSHFARWLPRSQQSQVVGAVPRAHLRQYWFQDPTLNDDGSPRYPAGRRILRNGDGDILLDDCPNPYWDGHWPCIMIDNKHDPDTPWGRNEVLAYRRIQEAINRIGHLFVENTLLAGNVWITADADALDPQVLSKLNNLGAIVLRKRFGRTVERNEPPQMPAHFLDFIKFALGLIEELSGLGDTTVSGRGRIELRSGEQLEGLQLAAQTLVRALARRVEGGLERYGRLWVSRVFQFYTQDRLLNFLGPGPEWMTYNFERQGLLAEFYQSLASNGHGPDSAHILARMPQAWQDFTFRIIPGSSLSTVRMQRARAMGELAERGMVSRVRVLEELGFSNPQEEIDRAMKEQAVLQSLQPQAAPSQPRAQGVSGVPGG